MDLALSEGVGDAIHELASRQLIGAVSCLTVSDIWPREAKRLEVLQRQGAPVLIGLSLTLTAGFPPLSTGFVPENRDHAGRLPTLSDLIRASRRFNLRSDIIESEFRAQIRRFSAHTGRMPSFLHLEPGIVSFLAASQAVTAALKHFGMPNCLVLVPAPVRPRNLLQRAEQRFLWRSMDQVREPWQRRMLVEITDPKRLPQRSSWRADGKIWTAVHPAISSPKDQARLARFESDPSLRVAQFEGVRNHS
ncbi:ChbG/HpnK family deacetylase [uncultured Cohaesibacter sp.]|uniref:ChbG/HpnK family deacetylase n=1 Tax=uncultured Cohaesibacter sp. TaxID=1002546 RepID=UPI0029C7D36A|nr:ChbG/HpnK family deacetylase [uncultured Cohaesibacter sp.]